MGWIRHHGLVVTGEADGDRPYNIAHAHAKAVELGLLVSPPVRSAINSYSTILIAPDGSKEGWETSIEFDEKREALKTWLRTVPYGFDWFEYAMDVDNDRLDITASSLPDEA